LRCCGISSQRRQRAYLQNLVIDAQRDFNDKHVGEKVKKEDIRPFANYWGLLERRLHHLYRAIDRALGNRRTWAQVSAKIKLEQREREHPAFIFQPNDILRGGYDAKVPISTAIIQSTLMLNIMGKRHPDEIDEGDSDGCSISELECESDSEDESTLPPKKRRRSDKTGLYCQEWT
jgi:hypothetical protein